MIIPSIKYAGQVAVDAAYPHGKARNETAPDNGTGTPLEESLVNDLWGLQQALARRGGIVPSGAPDTALLSQQLQAMQRLFGASALNFIARDNVLSKVVRDVVWDPVVKKWLLIYTDTDTYASPRGEFVSNVDADAVQIGSGVYGRTTNTVAGGSASNGSVVLITNSGGTVRRGNISGGFAAATISPSSATSCRPVYAWNLSRWIICGNDLAWYSDDDGDNWSAAATAPGTGANLTRIATDGTRTIAWNDSGDYSYTDDGTNWTDVVLAVTGGGGLAYDHGSGLWVMVRSASAGNPVPVLTSTDGLAFSQVGSIPNTGGNLIVASAGFMGGHLLVAAGQTTSGIGKLWASDDLGVTFQEVGPCLYPQSNGFGWVMSGNPWAPDMYFSGSQSTTAPFNKTLVTSLRGALV